MADVSSSDIKGLHEEALVVLMNSDRNNHASKAFRAASLLLKAGIAKKTDRREHYYNKAALMMQEIT